MVTDKLITLEKVLSDTENLPWEYALYIPESSPSWQQDMPVIVLDPEETEDPDDDPVQAKKNGLKYAMSISSLQDVIENARTQDPDTNFDTLAEALKYYYDNDAFISLGSF